MLRLLFVVSSVAVAFGQYGARIGSLSGGTVYAVNKTTLQIIGLKGQSGKFWFDGPSKRGEVSEVFLKKKDVLYKTGNSASVDGDIVINSPHAQDMRSFQKFGIADSSGNYKSSVDLSPSLKYPEKFKTGVKLIGKVYGVDSDEIEIWDDRTIYLPNFSFQGNRPPDGFIFVGKFKPGDNTVSKKNPGTSKCLVEGHDNPTSKVPKNMNRQFSHENIIARMPSSRSAKRIDFVAVYCYAVGVDFGHAVLPAALKSADLPPYIPPVVGSSFTSVEPWKIDTIRGQTVFDVFLGPNGGDKRGFSASRGGVPKKWVFYVNGYLAPEIQVQRGQQLVFKVFGGKSWRLYITNEQTGGYNLKPANEKPLVQRFASQSGPAGQMCWYGRKDTTVADESFSSFAQFKKQLYTRCDPADPSQPAILTWTPQSPGTFYYGSQSHYNMGWKIVVN